MNTAPEFSIPVNRYRYLFKERIKYFGLTYTQRLFAAEFEFLSSQLDFLHRPDVQFSPPICQIKGLP